MASYSLEQFVDEAEKNVRNSSDEREILQGIAADLRKLLSCTISPKVFIPRKDKYAMNLAFMPEDQSFSVIAAVWQPGQTSPIHDHLTWALVGLYEGEETEYIYRRLDDGKNPKLAQIEKVSERTNRSGHVTILGEKGIHRIDNLSAKPSFSIHVYGCDIGGAERLTYDPVTGEVGTFRSGYCNVLRDLDQY